MAKTSPRGWTDRAPSGASAAPHGSGTATRGQCPVRPRQPNELPAASDHAARRGSLGSLRLGEIERVEHERPGVRVRLRG